MLILASPLIILVAILLLGVHVPNGRLGAALRLPSHRYAPIVFGIVTAAVVWYVWGGLNAVAPVHDEASYLLQARTFASFHWAMPSPVLPEFFEQYHTFVTPTFASKYPPGHGLLLVPGIWLSLPGLVPVLLSGLAGALVFLLARRLTNPWVAILTVCLWLPTTSNLRFRSSYMSETTTSVLWLLGWWALLEWRGSRARKWLVVVAGCVAWMAITRPLTAVAFALPIGIVVLIDVARRRDWRALVRPCVVALAILAILPLFNWRTLGDWRQSTYETYARMYIPFDHPGFGTTDAKAERPLPPDMQEFTKQFVAVHATHTEERLPAIFVNRWRAMINDAFRGWRLPLLLLAILGLAALGVEGWFAAGSALLLTLIYLVYAHPAAWTIYYLEIFPLLPFLTALGIWTIAAALTSPKLRVGPRLASEWGPRQALGVALVVLVMLWPLSYEVRYGRRLEATIQSYHLDFRQRTAEIPDKRAIVFVRYAPWHNVHTSLIANDPDLADARLWVVYDRGPENAKLAALAPDRAAYLYDEGTRALMPIRRTIAGR
jgi:hypothetical protein